MNKHDKSFYISSSINKYRDSKKNIPNVIWLNKSVTDAQSNVWKEHCDNGPVYLFTNENIAGYLQQLSNIQGARVLSVAASGDHAFESYLCGASHVDTFDINSLQRCVMELKMHMIHHLEYDDFMEFFFDKQNPFNVDILRPVRSLFSKELTSFVRLFHRKDLSMFRYGASCAQSFNHRSISYLSSDSAYYALRKKLPENINFVKCDIKDLTVNFNQKYDLILLSNIVDYVDDDYTIREDVSRTEMLFRTLLSPLAEHNLVDKNGCMCFRYLWSGMPATWDSVFETVTKDLARNNIQNDALTFGYKVFESAQYGAWRDMMLNIYKNTR